MSAFKPGSKPYSRNVRVAEAISRELANSLLVESADPRFLGVNVTHTEVSRDLKYVKVFVDVLDDDKIKDSITALNHAVGFFQAIVAKKVRLRTTPKLHFVYDEFLKSSRRLVKKIEEASC